MTTNEQKLLRVLHIIPALFGADGIVGGAERYAFELARSMAEATPTTLVSFGSENRAEKHGALDVRVVGNPHYVRGQKNNPFAAAVLKFVLQFDVIHCHQQHILLSSLIALRARLAGRRVFVSDLGGGGWDISGYVSTDNWYHGHLHISEYSRKIFGHQNNPCAHVILGGVDTEKFSSDSNVKRDGTVLYVGRLLAHKGIDNLIRALPDNMRLEIIGRPYDERYYADLRALAAGKQVEFRQACDDAEIINAYRRALCIVLPSVYRDMYLNQTLVPELLGQTLLEGMACGTPAICTDVASMPEVVTDGVTGFVVPPHDIEFLRAKLLELRDNPAVVETLGSAARTRVLEHFTWQTVVERCLKIYRA